MSSYANVVWPKLIQVGNIHTYKWTSKITSENNFGMERRHSVTPASRLILAIHGNLFRQATQHKWFMVV